MGKTADQPRRSHIEEFLDADDRDPEGFEHGGERSGVSTHEVVDTGERLRILDRAPDGALNFRHRIMQAYLAARSLVEQSPTPQRRGSGPVRSDADWCETPLEWIGALLDSHHPERLTAHMTLTFAALHAYWHSENVRRKQLHEDILRRLVNAAQPDHKRAEGAAQRRTRLLQPLEPFDPENRFDPDDALAKLTTAAEIARATDREGMLLTQGDLQTSAAATIISQVKHIRGATRFAKLQAIPSIVALDDDGRWDCLLTFAAHPDHEVRRAASEAIEDQASEAYPALEHEIRRLIVRGARRSRLGLPLDTAPNAPHVATRPASGAAKPGSAAYDVSDRDLLHDMLRLTALGWVLPAIVSGLSEEPKEAPADTAQPHERSRGPDRRHNTTRPAGYLRGAHMSLSHLAALAIQDKHFELEGGLAKGFKRDAMRHATEREHRRGPGLVEGNRQLVTDLCLSHAGYWHARLALHQALALYAIAGSSERVAFDTYGRSFHREGEPHPFVRRAAHLARRAVARHVIGSDHWDSLIWADEVAIAGRRPTRLSASAAQLVGDITLLLSLKDRAPAERRTKVAELQTLPYCLSKSADRLEILGAGCPRGRCHHDLCPLTAAAVDEPNASRSVSRAFCRAEQRIARRRRPRWQRHIHRRALRNFWREMERRART